ncbi:hypothetical protein [Butyrivibrio sp. FC2001]|uniref:hypothetical protein n=1 Tax=Butyrivibrio sp. FC2001 TaxID=1280671 RepID=UPI00047E0325|nr:hypothetical protein [Butyrivibrio sp. FC2001]
MGLVGGKCPYCGANLTVDSSKDAAICQYCGSPFIVEKAIVNWNIQNLNAGNINMFDVNNANTSGVTNIQQANHVNVPQNAKVEQHIHKSKSALATLAEGVTRAHEIEMEHEQRRRDKYIEETSKWDGPIAMGMIVLLIIVLLVIIAGLSSIF